MPATTTVVSLPAFGAFTGMLVGRLPAVCQSSSHGPSTALNFTIAFPGYPSASFNPSAPICPALRPFTATKLA